MRIADSMNSLLASKCGSACVAVAISFLGLCNPLQAVVVSTVNDFITQVELGGLVEVSPGTYDFNGKPSINPGPDTVIRAIEGAPVILKASSSGSFFVVDDDCGKLQLEGLNFEGGTTARSVVQTDGNKPLSLIINGCEAKDTQRFVLQYLETRDLHLTYTNNHFTAATGPENTSAIEIYSDCSYATVTDSTFDGCFVGAIRIGINSANTNVGVVLVERNTIKNCWGNSAKSCYAIFSRAEHALVRSNTIKDTDCDNTRANNDGIYLSRGIVLHNTLHNVGKYGISMKAGPAEIGHNTITFDSQNDYTQGHAGISVSGAANVLVHNNHTSGAWQGIVNASYEPNNVYRENTIDALNHGYYVQYAGSNTRIEGGSVVSAGKGVRWELHSDGKTLRNLAVADLQILASTTGVEVAMYDETGAISDFVISRNRILATNTNKSVQVYRDQGAITVSTDRVFVVDNTLYGDGQSGVASTDESLTDETGKIFVSLGNQ